MEEDSMSDKLTFNEWKPEYEKKNDVKIIDDGGYRFLYSQRMENKKMTYQESLKYFKLCTIKKVGLFNRLVRRWR